MTSSLANRRKLKHQRTEDATSTSPSPAEVARSNIWFNDGSIVLQAECTQFRVHSFVLASHSKLFECMSALPQPAEQMDVDGCPLVEMHGDTAEDWTVLLSVLYHFIVIPAPSEDVDISLFRALMRLGKKYQFDDLRREACSQFVARIPSSLSALDTLFEDYRERSSFPMSWIEENIEDIISFASEDGSGIQCVLPIAYYLALRRVGPYNHWIFSSTTISTVEALRTLIKGYFKLSKTFEFDGEFYEKWDHGSDILKCSGGRQCMSGRRNFLRFICGQGAINYMLGQWEITRAGFKRDLCLVCSNEMEADLELGRESIYTNLPSYFGLPTWEELQKLDEEALAGDGE